MNKHELRTLILKAAEILDPNKQGIGWPDPIEWDGRPLEEQAGDMAVLIDTAARQAMEDDKESRAKYLEALADKLHQAAGYA